jgi:hypothetical protein
MKVYFGCEWVTRTRLGLLMAVDPELNPASWWVSQ